MSASQALPSRLRWAKWREATWEPAENLVGAQELLDAYFAKKPRANPHAKPPPTPKRKTASADDTHFEALAESDGFAALGPKLASATRDIPT